MGRWLSVATLSGLLACQTQTRSTQDAGPDAANNTPSAWSVQSNPTVRADTPEAIVLDGARLFVAGEAGDNLSASNVFLHIECRSTTDGSLVTSFGNGGVVELNPAPGSNSVSAAVVDDTALYIVGSSGDTPPNWFIARIDKTTGVVGWTQVSASGAFATSVAVDSTGVYIVGRQSSGTSTRTIEKRALADGTLVTGFGTAGVVNDTSAGEGLAVVTDGAGGIIVFGAILGISTTTYPLERRSGSTGSVTWTKNAFSAANSNSLGPTFMARDGSTVIISTVTSPKLAIEKYGLDGTFASSFGTAGDATWTDSSTGTYISAGLAASGAIYLVGHTSAGAANDSEWTLAAFDETSGALVPTFGSAGVLHINPSAGSDWATAIAADASAVYVAGTDFSSGDAGWRIDKIAR
jgi:hypothetical protein